MLISDITTALITGGEPSIINSETLMDATGLSVQVAAYKNYIFQTRINFDVSGVLGGYKIVFSGPNAVVDFKAEASVLNFTSGNETTYIVTQMNNGISGTIGPSGNHGMDIQGTLINGGNTGDLKIKFAQKVADPAMTKINKGSYLILIQG